MGNLEPLNLPEGVQRVAAAGHPHGVFKLHQRDLALLSDAPTADVTQAVST